MSPIPDEQQPLNQYQELKSSMFFLWPTLPVWPFWQGILKLWIPVLLLGGGLTASTLRWPQDWLLLSLISTCLAHLAVVFILLRLYLGWFHIQQRLVSERIFYEESGWYDGTLYQKTAEEYDQERLIAKYEVTPILKRLQRYLLGLGLLVIAEIGLGWWL